MCPQSTVEQQHTKVLSFVIVHPIWFRRDVGFVLRTDTIRVCSLCMLDLHTLKNQLKFSVLYVLQFGSFQYFLIFFKSYQF